MDLPDCAVACVTAAMAGGICAPTDQTCACTSESYQSNITACVVEACTVLEALATKNTTATACGYPMRDRTDELATITISMAVLVAVFVILRFGYKIFAKIPFGLDDWFILASTVTTAPSIFINLFGTTANGLGRDIWTLSPSSITDTLKFFWVACVLYFLETALTKLSMICFYIGIFPSTNIRLLLWVTFAITSAWGVAFVVGGIFQCQPISHFWTHWDGLHEGHCVDPKSIAWSNAITNIVFDLWILAIPLSQLRGLQLHWKKKAGVAIMFCLGTFVTVVSILRLESLVHFAATTNITWNYYDTSRWSTVEICMGIVCTCLPTTRLLLVRLFPILGGTSQRRPSAYHFQDIEIGGSRSRHKAGEVVAAKSLNSEPELYELDDYSPGWTRAERGIPHGRTGKGEERALTTEEPPIANKKARARGEQP